MWQILILFYFVFGTASYLLRRVLAQKIGEHNRLVNAIFYLFFLLPTIIVLSFFFPHNFHVGMSNIILLLVGSLIYPTYFLISFQANRNVDAGIFTIINNLSPLFTLIIALPFLHESLRAFQYVGGGLLILSGILVAYPQLKKTNRIGVSGIITCISAAAVLGFAVAYERFMLNRVDFGTYIVIGWRAQVVWSLLFASKELKKISLLFNKNSGVRNILIAWGSVSALRSVAFVTSLKTSGSAALISAASDFLSVAVVIAAYFFLKERENMIYKISAVIIGVIGLLLITR